MQNDPGADHPGPPIANAPSSAATTTAPSNKRKKKKEKALSMKAQVAAYNAGTLDEAGYAAWAGPEAEAALAIKSSGGLSLADVQHLLQHVLIGTPPVNNHFEVAHAPLVRKAVVVLCHGISATLLEQHPSLMQKIRSSMGEPVEMLTRKYPCSVAPNWFSHAVLNLPVTRQDLQERKRGYGRVRFPRPMEFYLHDEEVLLKNGFPWPETTGQVPDGYEETREAPAGVMNPQRLVACDCEMVRVASGLALARCTLLAEDGQVLMDEYVKPNETILDYNTRWSGITPQEMAMARMGLTEARARVLELVPKNTILVGHSLENDLRAMRVVHRKVLDTSLLYPHAQVRQASSWCAYIGRAHKER